MFENRNSRSFEQLPASERRHPVLALGQVVATHGAVAALEQAGELGQVYLRRHQCGDWGELDQHDWMANDQALGEGGRVLSAYTLGTGEKLWIITEADRSVTTLLSPEEY